MKSNKKIENVLSYGMSEKGIEKLFNDVETATTFSIEAITSYNELFEIAEKIKPDIASTWEERVKKIVEESSKNINENLTEISDLENRILNDWKSYKENGDV